jgi:GNAT superfamily N-acetyltransferase
MKITRRPALESDAAFCREVHHRAYRDVCVRQFGPWSETAQDLFFQDNWDSGGFEIILYDGKPCGYARIEARSQELLVHELVIDPGSQNRGIGSFLLREVIAQAQTFSLPIRLRALHRNRALELYRRFGFKESGLTDTHTLLELKQPTDGF